MKKAIFVLTALIIMQILGAVLASSLTIESVATNPEKVKPGERAEITLTITNELNDGAEDISISLDLSDAPFAPYQSSNEARIDKLREDREKEIIFELTSSPSANAGIYKIPVKIIYTYKEEEREEQGLIGIIVIAEPKIELLLGNPFLIKGQNNEFVVKIVNSGLGDARLMSLTIGSAFGLKITNPSKEYIGNLDSDDSDSITINAFVNEDAPSSISLPLEISYVNSENEEIKENEKLIVKAYTREEAQGLGLIETSRSSLIITAVIVAIVLYLAYRFARKRLRKRRE